MILGLVSAWLSFDRLLARIRNGKVDSPTKFLFAGYPRLAMKETPRMEMDTSKKQKRTRGCKGQPKDVQEISQRYHAHLTIDLVTLRVEIEVEQ